MNMRVEKNQLCSIDTQLDMPFLYNRIRNSYTLRPPAYSMQCIEMEMTKKMPFLAEKNNFSRTKKAANGFRLCKLRRKGFHLGLSWASPLPVGGAKRTTVVL